MLSRAFLLALAIFAGVNASGQVSVAIIIDDLGHSLKKGEAFIELPAPITFAILPHTAHSKALAESANSANKEVIVHLPMANLKNTPIGPGGLTASQPRVDFLLALDAAIADVPFAKGMNNHTGSYLTQQPEQMSWLMSDMKRRGFYFVDSRTTPNSIARDTAEKLGVVTSSRDVFLDNERSIESIDLAFQKLIEKAEENGTAIAIGHPYPETLEYLTMALPRLKSMGISVLSVSELIKRQQQDFAKTGALVPPVENAQK